MKIVRAIFYSGLIFILVLTSCNQGGSSNQSSTDVQTKPEGQEVPKDSLVLLEELKSKRSALDAQIQELETKLVQNGTLGEKFKEVTIGKQAWMAENLNVTHFRNGDLIPQAESPIQWTNANRKKQAAWCYYSNSVAMGERYGVLYNYYAVIDSRGLAPVGWRVPSVKDWKNLFEFVCNTKSSESPCITFEGWRYDVADKLKSIDFWQDGVGDSYTINGKGSDEYGFRALPGGSRWGTIELGTAEFSNAEKTGQWWAINKVNDPPKIVQMWYSSAAEITNLTFDNYGLSVRCVK